MRGEVGECSNWFNVEPGLRQECVPAILLFNILFVAEPVIPLHPFEADPEIVNEMISFTRGATAIWGTAFGRYLWERLYADDALFCRTCKMLSWIHHKLTLLPLTSRFFADTRSFGLSSRKALGESRLPSL